MVVNLDFVQRDRPAKTPAWLALYAFLTTVSANTSFLIIDRVTGKPIPNRFFIENKLPLLDHTAQFQDPDGDGFLNEDEWRHSTNPNDKNSHPAYLTKLFFVSRGEAKPSRLAFMSHDVDGTTSEAAATFQVNQRGVREKTHFVKLGETIAGTDYKVEKFTAKSIARPTGVTADVSELTVLSLSTGERLILPLREPVDCFEGEAVLCDNLEPRTEFRVMTTQEFALKAEPAIRYRLLALKKEGAVITLPDGSRHLIPPMPERLLANRKPR